MSSKNKQSGSIQGQVLSDLLNEATSVMNVIRLPSYGGPHHNREYRASWDRWHELYGKDMQKRRAIRELRRKNWLKDRRKGDEVLFTMNTDALVSALRQRILSKKDKLPDGFRCYISYDFPNAAEKTRNKWRYMIRCFGFDMQQYSLYSTDLDVQEEIRGIIELLEISDWVQVFVAKPC